MDASLVLVLSAILATALGGPISGRYGDYDDRSCARTCTDTSKFRYVPGKTYEFEYDIQTQTSMEGASSERASLGIKATADVAVISKCDMALMLRDVKVYRSDPDSDTPLNYADESGEFKRNLERFPLRFSFQDGVVEELCPAEGESTWALNIKRGFLTAIQNSMDRLDKDQRVKESDVAGNCYTDYSVTNAGWYSTSIKKVKDILGCTDRHGYQSAIHASPYRVPSDIQSMPLMKSTHENTQEVDKSGLLKTALLKETHTFRPFSQESSGATTKILQKVARKSERSGVSVRQDAINARAGLTYEHVYGNGERVNPRREVEQKLSEICRDTAEDIRPETPRLFSELVYTIKNMDVDSLREVYKQLKRGSLCRDNNSRTKKFFIDAIPMASTTASVEFLAELLNSKDVSGSDADMWISSLALINHPTVEMFEQVKKLIESPDLSLQAMLPVSTMINTYCTQHADCGDEYPIINIISVFEKNIGYGCYVRDQKLETILMTLRALGNAGHVERIVDSVRNCFMKQENPVEVRVSAIQAFRRLSCNVDRNELMAAYRDMDEDYEVRNAAYLAVIQCPSQDVLTRVQETLENEKANQVGSFVWSHLTNLQESSSPQKETIRKILQDVSLTKEFDLEKLVYSRNYEGSLFLEKFNLGAMVDSNVIFSDKSFIPRSAMTNLTVDLFGNSINLMEIGGRIEGLEYLLETYLGPYGYFGDKSKESMKQSRQNLNKMRGSLYMRMFGNEMMFKHFKGKDSLLSGTTFNYLDFLIKMSKKHDYSFTQSMMILDSSMIIPTSSGLPLNLTVNGTASVTMVANGQVDLRKVAAKPRSLLIDGTVKPSGAIQIAGTMSMDAFVTKSGLRIVNTWHSSTALQGRVELTRGKILSAELKMPKNKMEIFDVKTSFFTIHGDLQKEEKLITDNRKELKLCTGDRLAKITGLEICNEFQWPNASMKTEAPYFPFTGPFSYSMTLHKRDSHSGYKLIAKRTENKVSSIAQLAFDTPGSKVNRALSFDMTVDYKKKDLEMVAVSPWKKATATGKLRNEKNIKAITGKVTVDDSDDYSFVGQVKTNKGKDGSVTYKPSVELRKPGTKAIMLSGSVETQKTRKADIDLSLDGVAKKPITLKVTAQNTNTEKSIQTRFSMAPKQEYRLEASLLSRNMGKKNPIMKYSPKLTIATPDTELVEVTGATTYKPQKSLDGDVSVSVYRFLPKPLTASWKLTKNSGKGTTYVGSVKVRSKYINTQMKGTVDMKRKSDVATKFSIDYSVPAVKSIKPNRFDLSSKFSDKSTKTQMKYNVKANFIAKKYKDWNFATNFDMMHNKKDTSARFELKHGRNQADKSKYITAAADIRHDIMSKTASVKYNVSAQFPPKDVDFLLTGKHKHDKKMIDSSFNLGYAKKKSIDVSLELKDNSKKVTKMSGRFNLASPFKNINLKTDLNQNKKDYTHQITLKLDNKKSTVITTYKKQKGTIHSVDSDINLHFMKPIDIGGTVDVDMKDFKAEGRVKYAGKLYSVETAHNYKNGPKGKWSLELICPAQHALIEVKGGKEGTIYTGTVDTKWNVGTAKQQKANFDATMDFKSLEDVSSTVSLKYPSRQLQLNLNHKGGDQYTSHADFSWASRKKVAVDTTFMFKKSSGQHKMTGTFNLETPFADYKKMSAEISSDNDRRQYMSKAEVTYGAAKTITGSMTLEKPYSLGNINVKLAATSPFIGYRRMNVDVSEKVDRNRITGSIQGNLEGKNVNVDFNAAGVNNGDWTNRNVEGTFNLNSNIRSMRRVSVEVKHEDNNRKFVTDLKADLNGNKYSYDLDMNHAINGWRYQNDGSLILKSPRLNVDNRWSHKHTDGELKTNMRSEWGRGKVLSFDLSGNHDSSRRTLTTGGMKLQTPWDPVRDIDVSLNNEFTRGMIQHSLKILHDQDVLAATNLNYRRSAGNVESDFSVTSPFAQSDITGKFNTRYNNYPVTAHAEFGWSPVAKISADGSFNGESMENLDGELRVTTPFRAFRNILVKGSNRYENNEWLTSGLLDYAPRKAIQVESHVTTGSMKKARVTLKTPFSVVKMIDTGVEFNGGLKSFNGRADFTMEPNVGKYGSILNWNIRNRDITGKLRIDTPLNEYKYGQISISSQEIKNGKRHSRFEVQYYPRETISLDVTSKIDIPFQLDIEVDTPFTNYEHMSMEAKHAPRPKGIDTHFEVNAVNKKAAVDFSLKWKKDIQGSFIVVTPIRGYERSKLSFTHDGELTNFKCHAEAQFARQGGEADVTFKHDAARTNGAVTVKTPFSGFEESKAVIKRRGGWKNLDSEFSANVGTNEMKIALDNAFRSSRISTNLLVQNPFTEDIKLSINHNGGLKNFDTKTTGSYGSTHRFNFETDFTMRQPLIDLSGQLVMTCPEGTRNMGMKFHKEGALDNINVEMSGEYNGQSISVNTALNTIGAIEGSLKVMTPFDDFTDIGLAVKHSGDLRRFTSEGSVTYMDGLTIEGDVTFSHNGLMTIQTNGQVKTPFTGYRITSFNYDHTISQDELRSNGEVKLGTGTLSSTISATRSPIAFSAIIRTPYAPFGYSKAILKHEGPLADCNSHAEFDVAGWTLDLNSEFLHGEQETKTKMAVNSNIAGMERLTAEASREGGIRNLRATGKIQLRNSGFDVSLNNRFTGDRLVTAFTLNNPYTEDIKINVNYSKQDSIYDAKMSASMGPDATLSSDGKLILRGPEVSAETNLGYSLTGMTKRYSLKLGKNGDWQNMEGYLTTSNGDDTIDLKAALDTRRKIHGEMSAKTPFNSFRNIAMTIDHSGLWNRFTSEGSVTYMDGKTVSGKINHSHYQLTSIDSSIEVNTPFEGFENTQVEYKHSGRSGSLECSGKVQYGRGRKISGELSASMSPKYEISIKANTPFSGYRRMSASGAFGADNNRYDLSSNLNVGRQRISFDSNLDISERAVSGRAHLQTPFENYKDNEITFEHNGQLTDFKTTATMKSSTLETVSGEVILHYSTPFDMNALLDLHNGMKVSIDNTDKGGRRGSHIVTAWAPEKEIVVDGSYKYSNTFYDTSLSAEASITSPFEQLRQGEIKIDHSRSDEKATQKMEVGYNSRTVLDMDVEYNKLPKHNTVITFREPRAMEYSLSGEMGTNTINTELFVNWDKDDTESNVRFQTSLNDRGDANAIDKNMMVKLIHPARTMGVIGTIAKSGRQTKSVGSLIWDEDQGKELSYDLDVTDKSTRYGSMYDGSMKLNTPVRTFQMDGSYSDARGSQTVDGSFFWDAKRDQTKEVGIKAVLTPSASTKKAEVSLRLPSISKDLSVATELTMNEGRTIFDGKTELSYSSDSRKTVTLTSKIEDISYGYSNKNYSMAVGISHPYTDVDVQMSSNIGKSDEKFTGAVNMMYLTARRERKNFALRGEINKLRNQLNLEMVTPVKSLRMAGEVETTNPYRITLKNVYDDDRAINTELTINTERRFIDFQTNYDLDRPQNTINMHASYVNSTAVKAELFHISGRSKTSDSIIAMRLNSTRLLHTRLSWRPEMVQELQSFLASKVRRYGQRTKTIFHDMYEGVGEEVSGKYKRISTEVQEELQGYVKLVEDEMVSIERQLDIVRRDIRRMYRRNDLYIADMGQSVLEAFESYKDFVALTKVKFDEASSAMAEYLSEINQYPISEAYRGMVTEYVEGLKAAIDSGVRSAVDIIARIDDGLQKIKERYNHGVNSIREGVSDTMDSIKNHPRVVAIKNSIADMDYQQYLDLVHNRIRGMNIPQRYNNAIYTAREAISQNFADLLEHEDVKHIRSLANDAYQEGVWAYNYWELEENVQEHVKSILATLKELLEDEFRQYKDQLTFLQKSRITVWDPEHGEIQLEIYLPIAVQSLDTIPEVDTTYIDNAKKTVLKYIPDRETIDQYYQKYAPSFNWRSDNTTKQTVDPEINEYMQMQQKRRPRRMRRQRRVESI